MEGIGITYTLLALALLSGIVAGWRNLSSDDSKRRRLGGISIGVLAITLGFSAIRAYSTYRETETARQFAALQEREVDEASGATFWGGDVLVVDDESRKVFVFRSQEAGQRLVLEKSLKLEEAPGFVRPTSGVDGKKIKMTKIEDLEGAATFGDRVYLVTSHSTNKKGNEVRGRRLFLEVEVKGGKAWVHRAVDLKSSIVEVIEREARKSGAGLSSPLDRIEIEGLAIDPSNKTIYFGLRKPMLEFGGARRAIVLGVPLADIFERSPAFRFFALRLDSASDDAYAIVSLEYDPITKKILVLGGTTEKEDFSLSPTLWIWDPVSSERFQEPSRAASNFVRFPKYERAKLEAVVPLVGEEHLVFFVDSEGHGGQRVVSRVELGLRAP